MVADSGYVLDEAAADKFARLALACVHREYPNKIAHAMTSGADAAPPRVLTPAFYGCYDWHSAVHGHWLLARLARLFPEAAFARAARTALARSITVSNIEGEARYLRGEGRTGFERPYGLAWLLTLGAELRWFDPALARILQPLEEIAVERIRTWLPKLPKPDRCGQHSNTAFAAGMLLDWARATGAADFGNLLVRRALEFYLADRGCPLSWEPSGEDFLSPCLAEADLMRRIVQPDEFSEWLALFLPEIGGLNPVTSPDPADGKLAHLNGLNLSRAWMLVSIARSLPESDSRRGSFIDIAKTHASAGLGAVTDRHYEGGHWLGTFAAYLALQ